MAHQDAVEVRRENGDWRTLSVFEDGIVEHAQVPVVPRRRSFSLPRLPVTFLIFIGGFAAAFGIGTMLVQLGAPLAVVAWSQLIVCLGALLVTMIRIQLHRLRRWDFRVIVRDLGTHRETGRAWTVATLVMFEPAPSADELTVWTPDELEIPIRDLAGVDVTPSADGFVITIHRRSAEPLRYRSVDPRSAAVLAVDAILPPRALG